MSRLAVRAVVRGSDVRARPRGTCMGTLYTKLMGWRTCGLPNSACHRPSADEERVVFLDAAGRALLLAAVAIRPQAAESGERGAEGAEERGAFAGGSDDGLLHHGDDLLGAL